MTPGQVVGTGDPLLVFTRTGAGADDESSLAAADLDRSRADLDEVAHRHLLTLDEGRAGRRCQAAQPRSPHRAGEHRRPGRSRQLRRIRRAGHCRAAQPALGRGPDRQHPGRRPGRRPGDHRRGPFRAGRRPRRSWCPTTTPCWPERRACATTPRPTASSTWPRENGCRWCCSPRAAVAGPATPTSAAPPGWTCRPSGCWRGLSGQVPLVSIVSGRCFAGNAALAGVCDVIIATPDANIGMGGPAMIEGGGLGVYPPEAIGPIDVQRHNGVVSLVARDEAHAVSLAKQYLSYFQGSRRRLGGTGSAAGPTCGAGEPVTRLRRAPGDRVDRRRRIRARAAPRLRRGHRHRAGARRGRAVRLDRQQHVTISAARSMPRRPTRPATSWPCANRSGCR